MEPMWTIHSQVSREVMCFSLPPTLPPDPSLFLFPLALYLLSSFLPFSLPFLLALPLPLLSENTHTVTVYIGIIVLHY